MSENSKSKRNHTGQMPTDVPSKELIHPPKKSGTKKSVRNNLKDISKGHNQGNTDTGR